MAEVVTTIYCSGIPQDMTEREFRNLFLFAPGFEKSSLSFKASTGQPIGFARFGTEPDAVRAVQVMNGCVLDPQSAIAVRCTMAQSQLFDTRAKRTADGYPIPPPSAPKRMRPYDADPRAMQYPAMPPVPAYQPPAHTYQPPPPAPRYNYNAPAYGQGMDTLHIGSLTPTTSDEELGDALSRLPGYQGMKMLRKNAMPPVCFAKFVDAAAAGAAVEMLQGTGLPSTGGHPIAVSLAKSSLDLSRVQV